MHKFRLSVSERRWQALALALKANAKPATLSQDMQATHESKQRLAAMQAEGEADQKGGRSREQADAGRPEVCPSLGKREIEDVASDVLT